MLIKRKLITLLITFAAFVSITGCSSMPVEKSAYKEGTILLLPPRDVVQNGQAHEKGVETGIRFQKVFSDQFDDSDFMVITTRDSSFSHTEIASKEEAIKEAKEVDADYVMQVVLGEFLNAAPFTFRRDYVFVDRAVVYDVDSGEPVWRLTKQLYLDKSNIGNHYPLVRMHAQNIAESIKDNVAKQGE